MKIVKMPKNFYPKSLAICDLSSSVSSEWTDEGCLLNLSGEDVPLLLSENGEMLDAFETFLFQIYGRELDRQHRFICDADGFRQTRKAELQAMARFAAQNVRKNGRPFTFGVLKFDRTPCNSSDIAGRRRFTYRISRQRQRPPIASSS